MTEKKDGTLTVRLSERLSFYESLSYKNRRKWTSMAT